MLTIKSQKITPTVLAESETASFAIAQENCYAVFSYQSKEILNTQVAQNIITDIFTHSTVLEGDEAVLQVLEKSLKDCKEAAQKLKEDIVFTAVVAFFKDDFVYVSMYGDAKALYLDGTQMVHASTEKEGYFAGGTQNIEDGKVMVLCTHSFFKKFPPQSLISLDKPVLAQDLDDLSSAVILKVDRVAEGKPAIPVKDKAVDKIEPTNGSADLKKNIGTSSKSSVYPRAVGWVGGDAVKKVSVDGASKPKLKQITKLILIAVGALLLLIGGYFGLRAILLKPKPLIQPNNNVQKEGNLIKPQESPQSKEIQGELSRRLDEANKVKRVQAQVFYDISITDAKTSPSELTQGQNYLAVSDAKQGKIYVSAKDVTKFEELPQLFPGVRNLLFEGNTLIFTDNEGVKFYALATKSVNKSYIADSNYPTLGPASEYLGFTYAISGDRLVKFTKSVNRLIGFLWSQKPEFTTALSMDIDGSIYVLFSNGSLEKYTAGAKDDFSIVGLDKPIQKPLKVITDADFKQIYVADGEEGRILAFDTDGVLAFQIKPELGGEWTQLKSFDVSVDEKTFYVLSGTKVYEFKL